MKKTRLVWIASLVLALLAGCSQAERPALPTVSVACAAPCWEGLTPGQSTLADVQRYVARTVGPHQDRWVRGPAELGVPGCHIFAWDAGGDLVKMMVEDGVLAIISPPTPPGMTLRELVERYGPPDYLSTWLAIGADGKAYGQDAYYPKLGLAFSLHPGQDTVGRVEPDTPVAIPYYSTPGDLAHLVAAQYDCSYLDPTVAQQKVDEDVALARPWRGYGPVEVLTTH